MKFQSFLALLLATFLIVSCGENSEKSNESESKTDTTEIQNTQTPSNEQSSNSSIQLQNSTQTLNTTSGAQIQATTPKGINPPHGQPGHDCSIPVGQPLDGSSQSITTNQSGPRVNTTTQSPMQQAQTPAGINPPHGQPGHDCSIPVGQPLSGSAQTKTTNQAGPRVNNAGPRVNKVPQNFNQSAQTAPGMNPPHGQPGHDCSIPVGQPLKK